MFRILVIDDNQSICEILAETLNDKGHKVDTTLSSVAALELLKQNNYDIVITDLKMDNVSGIDILKFIRENNLDIEVIIITAFGTIETAIEAIRLGAADFILKPFEIQDIEKKIDNIINHLKLKLDNQYLTDELREIYGHKIIGKSKAILKVLDDIKKVAAVNSNVLILGETGTGKELIARAIHYSSARKNNAFVKVNCAALPLNY